MEQSFIRCHVDRDCVMLTSVVVRRETYKHQPAAPVWLDFFIVVSMRVVWGQRSGSSF